MKLKFRADAKDWLMFGIFCVLLLYLVAIAVLNLASFAAESEFSGLNPLPAFGPKYILITLVGFAFALVAIFTSVSSYFFDREKGVGISTAAKKDKGYSRWAEEKEFKKLLKPVLPGSQTSDAAGIPLINNGKELWVDDGEYHNLIIGSTGSGKTQLLVQPMVKVLAKKGESMIITDPKGEIYENNATELREKGYNVVLLNFRNPQQGNSWNPLTLPYDLYKNGNKDKANELLDDLAMNILYDEKAQNQDPFWEKTSADYFTGLALGLFEDAKEEEINLNSINLMTTVGEEKCGPSTYIKEYFSFKDQSSPAYINVSSTLMAPNETKSSILSVFKQKIKLFSSRENISEMLSHSDFDMKDIGRKKTAVFIVIQDEKKTYHSLVTIFLKQCYETLIDIAQENGGKLAYRTNFILDEFANMPPLKDVTTMVTAARSRSIRFSFIIQNFAQLYQVYGKENGETIKGNCGNIVYLISSEIAALEEISKMCGEVKSKEKDKTASTPLVTVSDLQRLPEGTVITLRIRTMPFKTKMMFNWKMEKENMWGKKYDKATYPSRTKGDMIVFDIKKFVDEKKQDKISQMLNNFSGNGNPGGMQSRPIPPSNPMMGGIDINDFFKKVDQKLAEIETQEKKDKAKIAEGSNIESNHNLMDSSAKPSLLDLTSNSNSEISKPSLIDSMPKNDISTKPSINEEVSKAIKEEQEKIAKEKEKNERLEKERKEEQEKIDKLEKERKEQEKREKEEQDILEKLRKQREELEEKSKREKEKVNRIANESKSREEELHKLEEKRKKQEQELLNKVEREKIDTNNIEKPSSHKDDTTDDQFFDDFFNDDDDM